jgi:hypothetical protein
MFDWSKSVLKLMLSVEDSTQDASLRVIILIILNLFNLQLLFKPDFPIYFAKVQKSGEFRGQKTS